MPSDPIDKAVEILARGGLVAFPTETVYGLGADATNEEAVLGIFAAKGRPGDHPVIVHLSGFSDVAAWTEEVPAEAERLAAAFWPGPLTMILKRANTVSDVVTGGQSTVGLRVPSHPVARALLEAFGRGIAGPSANRFGHVSPTTAAHVRAEFGETLGLILEGGQSEVGIESTIIDLSGARPAVLRPGGISVADLEAVLGVRLSPSVASRPRVSGALPSHYAPEKPAELMAADRIDALVGAADTRLGVLARRARPAGAGGAGDWVEAPSDARGYAHDLYANLRLLDASTSERILIEDVPDLPEWAAVRDRILRATTPRA